MERCVDIAAVIYLTLDEIIERYKVKGETTKKKYAMKHMTDLFVTQLVIPARKKISINYINHFFFFDVLGINENFA